MVCSVNTHVQALVKDQVEPKFVYFYLYLHRVSYIGDENLCRNPFSTEFSKNYQELCIILRHFRRLIMTSTNPTLDLDGKSGLETQAHQTLNVSSIAFGLPVF